MNVCVYCTHELPEKDLTEEHVIPQMFYPKELRVNSITSLRAPVCRNCNRDARKVQEQMRTWFTFLSSDTSPLANGLVQNEVKRSFRERPGLHVILKNKISLVNLKTPSGIFLNKEAATVKFVDEDYKNIERFLDLVVRGVLYNNHKVILPINTKIFHKFGFEHYFRDLFKALARRLRTRSFCRLSNEHDREIRKA